MSDINNSPIGEEMAVASISFDSVEPFTLADAMYSPIMKNKAYIGKAYQNNNVAGDGFNSSTRANSIPTMDEILEPEYDLCGLSSFKYFSDSLYACIQAYSVKIAGHGHELLEHKET